MKDLKRIERRKDGDIAWDADIPKLIDTKCREFVKSLLDTQVGEYDLAEVEFIVQSSIDTEFNIKRIKRRHEYVIACKELAE